MTNDAELRAAVRQAVEAGRLPDRRPDRTWGGRGGGDRCAICTSLVRREEAELELEFVQPDGRLDVVLTEVRPDGAVKTYRQFVTVVERADGVLISAIAPP